MYIDRESSGYLIGVFLMNGVGVQRENDESARGCPNYFKR